MTKLRVIAAAAALAVSTAALATVTFNPSTGTGFVGKGDVQLALGWNNAALQSNAGAVTFTYETQATYDVTCEWDSFNSGHQKTTIHHAVHDGLSLASRAVFDAATRNNKRGDVTGFNLLGYSSVAPTGDVPAVGDANFCNAHDLGPAYNDHTDSHTGAVVTSAALVEGSESAGIFANYGDRSVQLPY